MVLAITVGKDAPLVVRVSDEALRLQRWKPDGRAVHSPNVLPAPKEYWIHAARAERLAAAAVGAAHPPPRRVRVLELLDGEVQRMLADADDDTLLALTQRLDQRSATAMHAAIEHHPGIGVRLHAGGMQHLGMLAATPLRKLTLSALPALTAPFPTVRHLRLIGAISLARVAEVFPHLESLSIDATGAAIDLAPLRALPALHFLDCANGAIVDARMLAGLSPLRTLRLSRVTGVSDCSPIASLPLRTLAIEHLHELTSVQHLRALAELEQLELLGAWQFDIADVSWLPERARLVRASIDIGGRRKNLELYRCTTWAYPWPLSASLSSWAHVSS